MRLVIASRYDLPKRHIKLKIETKYYGVKEGRVKGYFKSGSEFDCPDTLSSKDVKIINHHLEGIKLAISQ